MSFSEYYDLYFKCQATAPYHIFVYDMVDSKYITGAKRNEQLIQLIFGLEAKIEQKERETGTTILHRGNSIIHGKMSKENNHSLIEAQSQSDQLFREDLVDPACMQGDCILLTVLRDRITEQEVDQLFEQTKKELRIPYEFHKANGYYETDDWTQGQTHYFRGYAIALLSCFHKEAVNQTLQAEQTQTPKALVKTK